MARRPLRRNPRTDAFARQLSIERMCQLAGVSRPGFYRSLQERGPVEEDMEARTPRGNIFGNLADNAKSSDFLRTKWVYDEIS